MNDVDRYLAELGMPRERPSAAYLVALHAAHVTRFAHDTVWMARGRVPEVQAEAFVEALLAGEGGGCFQLNGAFGWLLDRLGFDARLHRARVQRAFDRTAGDRPDAHMVVIAHVDDRPWYADVGLGNGLLEAVPLAEGEIEQPPFRYALTPVPEAPGEWRFRHDPRVLGLRAVEIEADPSPLERWTTAMRVDTTDPASPYLLNLTANRRLPGGVVSVVGDTFVRRGADHREVRRLTGAEEWEAVLRTELRLALPGLSSDEAQALWARASTPAPR